MFSARLRSGTLNESIRAETVLVVWDRPDIGKRDSVTMRTKMALKIAKDNKLDLVLRELRSTET